MKKIKSAVTLTILVGLTACGGGGGGGSAGTTDTNSGVIADTSTPGTDTALNTTTPTGNYASSSDKQGVFDRLNAERLRCGFGALTQNTRLDTAAQNHANYLSHTSSLSHTEVQGNTDFTGVTVADRWTYAGYTYSAGNENIGETDSGTWWTAPGGSTGYPHVDTYLPATNTLNGLLSTIYHMSGLLDGNREVGVGISTQDNTGGGYTRFRKILVIEAGVPSGRQKQQIATDAVVTYPCQGSTGANPFFNSESPNPFPGVDVTSTYYGTPVLIQGGSTSTVTVTSATITGPSGSVPTVQRNKANDPAQGNACGCAIKSNQVFLVPTTRLDDNTTYTVSATGTSTGKVTTGNPTGAFTVNFSFTTGTFTSP